MGRTGHGMLVVLAVMAVAGISPGDWNGFCGFEKAGCADSNDGPLDWSASEHVAWKTAIPGRGHSSPIVSGNAVYVTTTYESAPRASGAGAWSLAVVLLAAFLTMIGAVVATGSLRRTDRKAEGFWLHARLFVFSQLLVVVAVVVLVGRALLNREAEPMRYLLISVVLALSCLMLGALFTPLRSRRQLATSVLAFVLALAAWITLRHRGLALPGGSLKAMLALAILACPAAFGLVLLSAYWYARRRFAMPRAGDGAGRERPPVWRFVVTAGMGCITALAFFGLLLFRAADYQMPDRYVLDIRLKAEAGWEWAAAYLGLVLATAGICLWMLQRGRATKRLAHQRALFGSAVVLAAVYFAGINSPEKPREFIRAVVCLNQETGEIRWTCKGLVAPVRPDSRVVTHASATPATDGKRVYGYFGQDGLMCVSRDGELLWKRTEPLSRCKYGVGTSPVVKDGVLVIASDVMASRDMPSSVTAFDCLSGKPLWRKERKSHEAYAAYDTPLIRTLNGRDVVIVRGWHDITGYDLRTGEELWSHPMVHEGRHLVASPTCDEQRLYVVDAKQVTALSLSGLAAGNNPVVWSRPLPGEKSSTPVVARGLLLLVAEPGTAACLDAETGKILWKKRLEGRYYSSVLAMGDRALLTNDSGMTTAVALDGEFRSLAKNGVKEPVYASLVPQGRRLFLRTAKHLYCFQADGR